MVGAIESLRSGITTVQDMLGLIPLDDESTDVVIAAYRDAGIRVVFAPMVWDIPPIAMLRDKDNMPPGVQDMLGTKGRPVRDQFDYLEHQFNQLHPPRGFVCIERTPVIEQHEHVGVAQADRDVDKAETFALLDLEGHRSLADADRHETLARNSGGTARRGELMIAELTAAINATEDVSARPRLAKCLPKLLEVIDQWTGAGQPHR